MVFCLTFDIMTRLAASKKNLRCGINVMQREECIATLFTMTIEGEAAVNNAFFLESFTFWAIRMEAYSQHIFNYILLSLKT